MNDRDPSRAPATPACPLTRRRLLALAGGGLVLAACSGSSDSSDTTAGSTPVSAPPSAPTARASTTSSSTSTTSTTSSTTTTTLPPATTLPPPVQPLTGLPLEDPALLNRVTLVVKVSNDPKARPQTGLNTPDIVFEAWGAGPTRFATVFHSRDQDFVGPIRSCREQDVNLVGSFNGAVFACSGGNPGNIALLRDSDLLLITEGKGPGWQLDPKRGRPHKTHANTLLLRSNGLDRTGPAQQYRYRAVGEAATAGEAMTGFDLQMQQVSIAWRYDPPTGTYLRGQEGRPHVMTDGEQVSTENVIIAWTDYQRSSTDARSPNGDTTGTNPVNVFTGGRMITGTWSRADRLDPFAWNDESGAPILLTPGRTFVELANGGLGSFPGSDEFIPVA